MGFSLENLEILKQVTAKVQGRPVDVISAGYPDLLLSVDQVRKLYGDAVAGALTFRPDSASIIRMHKVGQWIDRVIDTAHLFELIGARLTVIDFQITRGDELIQDLNEPLRADLTGRFDLVFDAGTMEHCFNVGQVIKNYLQMARVGGFIHHSNPATMYNHGFYNFNPTFYYDFYLDNGHRLATEIMGASGNAFQRVFHRLPPVTPHKTIFQEMPNATVTVVAQKLHDNPVRWPIQSVYKPQPAAPGA